MIYHIGLGLGITVTDIDKMTAGEIIDLAYYRANKNDDSKEENKRKATQDDYDSF